MDAMRSSWTDERLDDLNDKVDAGFERVDRRFEQVDKRFEQVDRRFEKVEGDIKDLRTEMNTRFDAAEGHVSTRFDAAEGHVNARFDSMEVRFQELNRTLIGCGFGLASSFIGLIVAFVLTGH